ncbi:translation initiation factor IF-2 [Candidatus Dependentiae bacterium]
MRVYEAAKKFGISSKELLGLLSKTKIDLSSHMSVIPEEGIAYIEKKLGVKKQVAREVVKKKPIPAKIAPVKKELGAIKKVVKPASGGFKKDVQKRVFIKSKTLPEVRKDITEIVIEKNMPLFQAADVMGKSSGDLIVALLKSGMACNRNNILPVEVIIALAKQFGIDATIKNPKEELSSPKVEKTRQDQGLKRWPIVVVMGHVDHGKTTLLDFIRKMNTASREKGGITQHLGAYEVDSSHGKIVFLDTPGHEAFSFIRSRGAKITDIAVLIVAADDGVKPQTIEAIKHAKDSSVPIIVAINKIDKASSSTALQTVKRQLADQDLIVEDWGGEVVCVPISAKTGEGVGDLLEMIVLQAEMMDLKAEPKMRAKAFVLESKLEKGHGPVATVICVDGTIKRGDFFICGSGTGRVRVLVNSFNKIIKEVGPSIPVKVVGFDGFAEIGDWLQVVSKEEYLKAKSSKNTFISAASRSGSQAKFTLKDSIDNQINLIIKTDTRGSKEALEGSILKLMKKLKKGYSSICIVQIGVGDISESDIEMAASTGSIILGLHIKTEKNAVSLAKTRGVKVEIYDIIYRAIEYLEEILEKTKKVEKVWKKVSQLLVKKVFDIKKIGIVAGCGVQEGVVSKGNKVECMRRGKIVGQGRITSLQKEGKVVAQVHAGYECGFVCDGFTDWREDDIVNCYIQK